MISWDKDLTDRSTSSSSSPKNGIGFSEQYKIKDRNRRPTTSLWLLTEIPPPSPPKPTIETEDDSVGPHGVPSHFSRLLRQIKDRNRRPTTSLWLLTEIPPPSPPKPTIETEDDSVGPHGVPSHFSRLLRQIKDRNRRPTTSLWLLTEIPPPSPPKPTIETEDDSVGPHGVPSHFSRLLRQIKDRNRRPTTSLWLLTEIPPPSPPKPTIETEDDSVGPHGVPSHFSRLLHQIKDRNRGLKTSLWLLTEIPHTSCKDQSEDAKIRMIWLLETLGYRIAVYFAASPKVERGETREAIQCKQRWQKKNDLVLKFCGAYAAATRQKTSGQNEADTVKLAHKIFYNDHKIKFNLHHAWEELRNDQKWCEIASSKIDGSGKKRKYDDGAQSKSSQATSNLGDQPTNRPPSVKAAKGASGKRSIADH
uniref:No apical meristem-associated C-terminal domain-containing protein n=1 Tax=Brassica oleracea var. oleracea TaxID=109376 RepID=A0A0D3CKN3_BRAOL